MYGVELGELTYQNSVNAFGLKKLFLCDFGVFTNLPTLSKEFRLQGVPGG
jgi:hypothetical protein